MHSMKSEAREMNRAKLKRMGVDGETVNGLYGSEKLPPLMDTTKPAGKTPDRKRFATGGIVGMDGEEAAPKKRLDKASRGKSSTNVNVIIAPQGGGDGGMPKPPMPMPAPAAPPPPAPSGPPPGVGANPGALAAMMGGPGGAMSGGAPMGLKTGGRAAYKRGGKVKRETGGSVPQFQAPKKKIEDMTPAEIIRTYPDLATPVRRATGGKVYDAGAGSGDGRLEKKAAYGKKAYEGEGR